VTMICSSDDHRRFFAAREVRSFGWAGTSISSPRSMMGGRMVVPRQDAPPPYYRRNWRGERGSGMIAEGPPGAASRVRHESTTSLLARSRPINV
jgi:hypothetical protein